MALFFYQFTPLYGHNQKFTDKSPKNDGLSVKCVLITDKSAKNGILSVKLSEILVEQHYFFKDVFLRAKRNVVFNRGCHLRANPKNQRFARNQGLAH